jgi:hypothetical protein
MRNLKNYKSFYENRKNEEVEWTSSVTSAKSPSWISTSTDKKLFKWCSEMSKKVTGWSKSFYDEVMQGKIKVSFNKQTGMPNMMLFSQKNGPIWPQIQGLIKSGIMSEAYVPLEYTGEDASVRNVSAEELVDEIEQLYYEKTSAGRPAKPIFVFGAPGIGKTEIVAQAADKLGIDFLPLDIPNMAMEDLVGVPEARDGVTYFNPTALLPRDLGSGKGGIIFLDELNKSDEVVLRRLNQFIQMGRLPGYQLPAKWIFVAAGNRREDKVDISEMDASFVQRFKVVNYVPEVGIDDQGRPTRGWAKHVSSLPDVMPELVYFLAESPEYFFRLDADKPIGIFASPRSWTLGAQQLHSIIKRKGLESWRDLPKSVIENVFHDAVGPESSGKFMEFLDVLKDLTDAEMKQILEDAEKVPAKEKFKKNKRFLYAITESLIRKVPKASSVEEQDKMLYNVVKYINKYGNFEILNWVMAKLKGMYPDRWNTGSAADSSPGAEWVEKAIKIYLDGKKKAKL